MGRRAGPRARGASRPAAGRARESSTVREWGNPYRRCARSHLAIPRVVAGRAPYTGRPVFDALSEKLQETLADVRAHGTLTEEDINKAMREIRLALLEADVNFKVVKQFTATVKERCLGAEVVGQLNPGQQVVKIVHEELASLMGGASMGITFSPRPPTVILVAGLQGSGKTTATAKLARYLATENGSSVALAAWDVYRPPAGGPLAEGGGPGGA